MAKGELSGSSFSGFRNLNTAQRVLYDGSLSYVCVGCDSGGGGLVDNQANDEWSRAQQQKLAPSLVSFRRVTMMPITRERKKDSVDSRNAILAVARS